MMITATIWAWNIDFDKLHCCCGTVSMWPVWMCKLQRIGFFNSYLQTTRLDELVYDKWNSKWFLKPTALFDCFLLVNKSECCKRSTHKWPRQKWYTNGRWFGTKWNEVFIKIYLWQIACDDRTDRISMYQLAPEIPWFARKTARDPFEILFRAPFTSFRFFIFNCSADSAHVPLVWLSIFSSSSLNRKCINFIVCFFEVLTHVDFYWNRINPFGSFAPMIVAMFVSAFSPHFFCLSIAFFSFHFILYIFDETHFSVSLSLRPLANSFPFFPLLFF